MYLADEIKTKNIELLSRVVYVKLLAMIVCDCVRALVILFVSSVDCVAQTGCKFLRVSLEDPSIVKTAPQMAPHTLIQRWVSSQAFKETGQNGILVIPVW